MSCNCVLDADVYDFVDVLDDKIVKSRRNYTCTECGEIIQKGEEYRSERTVHEGHFDKYRTCFDCNSIRENLVCSFYYGEILKDIRNNIIDGDPISEDCLAQLTPGARERICVMIEERWELEEEWVKEK